MTVRCRRIILMNFSIAISRPTIHFIFFTTKTTCGHSRNKRVTAIISNKVVKAKTSKSTSHPTTMREAIFSFLNFTQTRRPSVRHFEFTKMAVVGQLSRRKRTMKQNKFFIKNCF